MVEKRKLALDSKATTFILNKIENNKRIFPNLKSLVTLLYKKLRVGSLVPLILEHFHPNEVSLKWLDTVPLSRIKNVTCFCFNQCLSYLIN